MRRRERMYQINIMIPPDLLDKLDSMAIRERKSRSQLIRELLERALKEE